MRAILKYLISLRTTTTSNYAEERIRCLINLSAGGAGYLYAKNKDTPRKQIFIIHTFDITFIDIALLSIKFVVMYENMYYSISYAEW